MVLFPTPSYHVTLWEQMRGAGEQQAQVPEQVKMEQRRGVAVNQLWTESAGVEGGQWGASR